jgi:hypothetical protein
MTRTEAHTLALAGHRAAHAKAKSDRAKRGHETAIAAHETALRVLLANGSAYSRYWREAYDLTLAAGLTRETGQALEALTLCNVEDHR